MAIAQTETNPLTIDLKIHREYTLKFHKSYFKRHFEEHPDFKVDSLEQQFFKVTIGLRNLSSDTIFIWMMTCSWPGNFALNNKFVGFDSWPCDKNHPTGVVIPPKSKKEYEGLLVKKLASDFKCTECVYKEVALETKVGLINHCAKPSGFCPVISNENVKRTITWSNPITTKISIMR